MKKRYLFSSIFQVVIGTAAILAYGVVAASGEALGKWTVTLILAIAFLVLGVLGIVDCVRSRGKHPSKDMDN